MEVAIVGKWWASRSATSRASRSASLPSPGRGSPCSCWSYSSARTPWWMVLTHVLAVSVRTSMQPAAPFLSLFQARSKRSVKNAISPRENTRPAALAGLVLSALGEEATARLVDDMERAAGGWFRRRRSRRAGNDGTSAGESPFARLHIGAFSGGCTKFDRRRGVS